jgi:hypothetical protein
MDARKAHFAACKRLALTDDDRHALYLAVIGKASSRDFTPADWRRILDHLNKLTGIDEWAWVNAAAEAKRPAIWKIRRLVLEIGIHRGAQVAYAEGVAKRISGHERHLRMMGADELAALIGPLTRTLAAKRAAA